MPRADFVLKPSDTLLVIGTDESIKSMYESV